MAVKSIRFNKKEEKILKFLKDYFHCDTSSLLKKSLWELYEELKYKEVIEIFEKNESQNKIKFNSIEETLS